MNEEYFEIITRDGLTLHGKKWGLESPKATLCLVHGFGEHLERYNHVAEFLNSKNIEVYSFDLRGHGKSTGRRGHSKKYEYLLDDVEEILITAREERTDLPIFLMGHSFGGNIVANYMIRDKSKEVKGVILSSPWLRLAFEPPAAKVKLAKIMNNIFPGYREKTDMELSHLSKDPEVGKTYSADPLTHSKLSAGLFLNIYESGIWAIENASKLSKPTLLYHGQDDKIIAHSGSEDFKQNSGENVQFVSLQNVFHEPHNDLEKQEVFNLISVWIDEQLAS